MSSAKLLVQWRWRCTHPSRLFPALTVCLQDAADVQRVRQGLQRALPPGLLQDRRLLYKADIYTHLGIYSRNEWQLKPTVHEARLA